MLETVGPRDLGGDRGVAAWRVGRRGGSGGEGAPGEAGPVPVQQACDRPAVDAAREREDRGLRIRRAEMGYRVGEGRVERVEVFVVRAFHFLEADLGRVDAELPAALVEKRPSAGHQEPKMTVVGQARADPAGREKPRHHFGVELEAPGIDRDGALRVRDHEHVVVEMVPEAAAAGGIAERLDTGLVLAQQRIAAVGRAAAGPPPVRIGLEELALAEAQAAAGELLGHVERRLEVVPLAEDARARPVGHYIRSDRPDCGFQPKLRHPGINGMTVNYADELRHLLASEADPGKNSYRDLADRHSRSGELMDAAFLVFIITRMTDPDQRITS